jgi:nucleoside-diphosphate-sugar epimerase
MKAVVTGAAGHLGEALIRRLAARGDEVIGLDRLSTPYVRHVGDISDANLVARALVGAEVVFHAATLHKPHIASHTRQAFIDTNITGTNIFLDAALRAGVRAFIFASPKGSAIWPGRKLALRRSVCGQRASSPRRTTIRVSPPPLPKATSGSTSSSTAAAISRT